MAGKAREFGPRQGLWLMLGYVLAQLAGNALPYVAWGVGVGLDAELHGPPAVRPHPGDGVLAWAALLGFVISALWLVFYIRRRARPLLRQGDARGIAWCAPRQHHAYAVAAAAALAAMLFASLMVAALPPDPDKLTGPLSRLLSAPGWPRFMVLVLAVGGAPLVEELLFRGALFAAVARRWGVSPAGIVTTAVFMLLHVFDKIDWWPGFVVVGMLGALLVLLRVRYRSLWPGVFAHFLYNSSLFFIL